MRPALTCLKFAPHDNNYFNKLFPNMGTLSGTCSFCPFWEGTKMFLVHIILGSDCSRSVKE